jgi:hypothetical protein
VLAHRKKWYFCKVTPVTIQAFVEGLLRLANVLEATNGTLKNVNNICTLVINSAKHPSKKIPNCPKSFLSLPWLPSNNQRV